jgi:hypothetical protein
MAAARVDGVEPTVWREGSCGCPTVRRARRVSAVARCVMSTDFASVLLALAALPSAFARSPLHAANTSIHR